MSRATKLRLANCIAALSAYETYDKETTSNWDKYHACERSTCDSRRAQADRYRCLAMECQRLTDEAEIRFKRYPRLLREQARQIYDWACTYARGILQVYGRSYSGETTRVVRWLLTGSKHATPSASTFLGEGRPYSSRSFWRRTNAVHELVLAPWWVIDLYNFRDNPLTRWLADHEQLPLIGYDATTRYAYWLGSTGPGASKRLHVHCGYIAGYYDSKLDRMFVGHSDHSYMHAAGVAEARYRFTHQSIRRSAKSLEQCVLDVYKKTIPNCCDIEVTLKDARECGLCESGIYKFKLQHRLGDRTTVGFLWSTGDAHARRLAIYKLRRVLEESGTSEPVQNADSGTAVSTDMKEGT